MVPSKIPPTAYRLLPAVASMGGWQMYLQISLGFAWLHLRAAAPLS